ncbi:Hypothetical predicted protein [Olea europaea subsp. europaea]|uniref:Uncharacterized protein n=1 Tax=Olea europaea subsp. europaea TaxID=158383 RepID=A0A8S0U8V0_OLEEU|nr:Hypothetical predicted protein [Olea europaea subsp. europaea]
MSSGNHRYVNLQYDTQQYTAAISTGNAKAAVNSPSLGGYCKLAVTGSHYRKSPPLRSLHDMMFCCRTMRWVCCVFFLDRQCVSGAVCCSCVVLWAVRAVVVCGCCVDCCVRCGSWVCCCEGCSDIGNVMVAPTVCSATIGVFVGEGRGGFR